MCCGATNGDIVAPALPPVRLPQPPRLVVKPHTLVVIRAAFSRFIAHLIGAALSARARWYLIMRCAVLWNTPIGVEYEACCNLSQIRACMWLAALQLTATEKRP